MMRKLILFCFLIFFFLFLSLFSVRADADCPVCPKGYFWNMNYRACQEGPVGIPNPHYIDPIYVDCKNCQCNPGNGCQSPCDSPLHPGTYTCRWLHLAGYCDSVPQCTGGNQPGNKCNNRSEQECAGAGPFTCVATTPPAPGEPYNICQGDITGECQPCIDAGNSWTALGCIATSDPQAFIAWLLARAIGIAGGIAFLLMIFAGFQIITSAGDPKRLQSGKEMLTSAIIGLMVIIFSLFLLQLIGVQILKIPGFGE